MEIVRKLTEHVEILIPENGVEEKIEQAKRENRKLIVKLGFDPTAPDLHLGHAIVLKKLRQFQDLGHQIVILVGSFTARIGDPTGKNKSRKPLSVEEVAHNAQTYLSQLSRLIDVDKARIVFNSDWLDQLPFSDVIQLLSKVTVAQLMQRNDFGKRFTANAPIGMHELVYPILQAFDSVQIQADIEMGGTDQLFNCTMGRQLQESYGLSPQIVMCMPLLKGLDGKEKMSKSLHNTIGLIDTPNEMFGKTMSMPDSLIDDFLRLTTDFTAEEKQAIKKRLEAGANPMEIKKIIAKNIISQYHSEQDATEAEIYFQNQFQHKNAKEKVYKQIVLAGIKKEGENISLIDLCVLLKQEQSKSAVRRLITGGAVQVDGTKVTDPEMMLEIRSGVKIKIGKLGFYELG